MLVFFAPSNKFLLCSSDTGTVALVVVCDDISTGISRVVERGDDTTTTLCGQTARSQQSLGRAGSHPFDSRSRAPLFNLLWFNSVLPNIITRCVFACVCAYGRA